MMKPIISIVILSFTFLLSNVYAQRYGDADLKLVQSKDRASRNNDGGLQTLSAAEHLYRADVYMANRNFPQAREHWQTVVTNYPNDTGMSRALFGMGRSNMWETNYAQAIFWFDKLIKDYVSTFDGLEGLAFKGACLIRLGRDLEAAQTYELYASMFPNGNRIDSAYLNIIDAYREAGQYDKANIWVAKTQARFSGTETEINALHARLRMEVFRANWRAAITAADELLTRDRFAGSMAYENEVKFLKGYALERIGERNTAISVYTSIPASATSYFGTVATERINTLGGNTSFRENLMRSESKRIARNYPVKYRYELLRYSKFRGIDPRFVLAIMKQESSFRANAKSPAAARG
ncbi:MAG: tetratricopeptide repeat protein, partial [Pyrinomonadaceae bacterium]